MKGSTVMPNLIDISSIDLVISQASLQLISDYYQLNRTYFIDMLQFKQLAFCKQLSPAMDQLSLQSFSSTRQLTPSQHLEKEAQPEGYDAGGQLKTGMPKLIKSTAFRLNDVEELTLQDVEILCDSQADENQSKSSEQQDSLSPTKSTLLHIDAQQPVSYFNQVINFIQKIELKQIVLILLLVICILFGPSETSAYDMGEYTIYETVYARHMFQKELKPDGFALKQSDFFENWLYPADQDRLIIYLPKSTQKMRSKDEKQLSYTKCIESTYHGCVDYRLRHYGSMNLELQNWVLDHISGSQRLAFESNINFLTIILLTAMKAKQFSIGSETKKIVVIESYMGQIHTNAIKLSLIENQCQDVVGFLSQRQSFHGIMKSFEYVFVSQVFYLFNIYPFQQGAGLQSSLTFVIYVPYNADSFLVILRQETSGRQQQMIRFQVTEGKYYVSQQINITSERGIGSKQGIVILIKHTPSTLCIGQIMPVRL